MQRRNNMNRKRLSPERYNTLMNALRYCADVLEEFPDEEAKADSAMFARTYEKILQYSFVSGGEFDFETREVRWARFICTDREEAVITAVLAEYWDGFERPGYDRDYADELIDKYAAWLERKEGEKRAKLEAKAAGAGKESKSA